MRQVLWAQPSMKPVDRKRYIFGIDDVALAMLASSAIGAGASMYGASQNKSAQPGVPERYEWANYPIRPEYQQVGEFLQRGMQRGEEGKAPVWFENYRPQEEAYRQKKLYQQYFGGPGTFGSSILNQQQATDVAAGRRGAGAGSNYAGQLDAYSQKMEDINNLLSNLGYQTINQTMTENPRQLADMFQPGKMGQFLHFGGYGGTPYQAGGLEQFGTALGATAPYLSMLNQGGGGYSGGSAANDYFNQTQYNRPSDYFDQNQMMQLRQPTTTPTPFYGGTGALSRF